MAGCLATSGLQHTAQQQLNQSKCSIDNRPLVGLCKRQGKGFLCVELPFPLFKMQQYCYTNASSAELSSNHGCIGILYYSLDRELITILFFSVQIPASRIVAAIFLELAFTAEIRVMLSRETAPGQFATNVISIGCFFSFSYNLFSS